LASAAAAGSVSETEIWAKVVPVFGWMRMRGNRFLTVFGRLAPGATPEQAAGELTAILRRGAGESQDLVVNVVPLKDQLVGPVRSQLLMIMAAGLVLLIACGNVAYLLLARTSRRQSEIALRLSIGASRGVSCSSSQPRTWCSRASAARSDSPWPGRS
jgi:hypothetical protein